MFRAAEGKLKWRRSSVATPKGMLTFFTTAKPFQELTAIHQRNALKSWKNLAPGVEVIVFGNDAGVAEACAELGLRHESHMELHGSGMKYLDYMFRRAQEIAGNDYLCYSNCDIIQMSAFRKAIEKSLAWRTQFLLVARRWDTDVNAPISFEKPGWEDRLRELAVKTGKQQIPDFIDFFVFPRGLYNEVPPLLVGRSYWDHWLVWKALSSEVPVVDASRFVVAVHQNHEYGYHPQGKQGTSEDDLARRNVELAGNGKHLRSIPDATHAMTRKGTIVRTPLRRQATTLRELCSKQGFLNHTFDVRSKLGLRRRPTR